MTFRVDGQVIAVLSPPPGGYRNLPAFSGSRDDPWGRGTKLAPFDKEVKCTDVETYNCPTKCSYSHFHSNWSDNRHCYPLLKISDLVIYKG